MCIYFIQPVEGGLIKIGYADNVQWRFRTIQSNSPVELKILNIIEGGSRDMEAHIHRYFGEYRIRYEWFMPTEELLDFIKNPYQIECHDKDTKGNLCCKGIRRNGSKCQNQKSPGSDYCKHHQNQASGLLSDWVIPSHIPVRCKEITKDGSPCNAFVIPGYSYCGPHKSRHEQ